MSGRVPQAPPQNQSGKLVRRRRSLLYRITDTITSFLPSIFESRREDILGRHTSGDQPMGTPPTVPRTLATSEVSVQSPPSRSPGRFSISRVGSVQIPSVPTSTLIDADVDLDARDDRSEYSLESRTSVSTSGVSSLLPRSYRTEHGSTKPSPIAYSSECIIQRNGSNTRKRGSEELWTDIDRFKQMPSTVTQSASKRMRTESGQSSLSTAFSSPFYRGRISYGGASSLGCAFQPRSVFEHVAPLRFIMEDDEEKPKRPSNSMLSVTAQRILHSLESHSSSPYGDKFPLPTSIPFSQFSRPLQRNTVRYPPYMATYNRYKEFKRQNAVQAPQATELATIGHITERNKDNDSIDSTVTKTSTGTLPVSKFFSSVQSTNALSAPEKLQTIPCLGGVKSKSKQVCGSDGKNSQNLAEFLDASTSTDSSVPTSSSDLQISYTFSNPIALKRPTHPTPILEITPKFTFSYPQSQFKKPAPVEKSSFFSTLVSSRPVDMEIQSVPPRKTSVPPDLGLWRCESCLTENSEGSNVCMSCRLPNSGPSASKSVSTPVTSDKPVVFGIHFSSWQCPTCMTKNRSDVAKCVCCQTSVPSSVSEQSVTKSPPSNSNLSKPVSSNASSSVALSGAATTVSNFVDLPSSNPLKFGNSSLRPFLISGKGWDCPTCLVKNDDNVGSCPCCKTAKPKSENLSAPNSVKPALTPNVDFSSLNNAKSPVESSFLTGKQSNEATVSPPFRFGNVKSDGIGCDTHGKGRWICSTCSSENDGSIVSCRFCQTKKPTPPTLTLDVPSKSEGKWDCPTCLVRNNLSADSCPCCQTRKPSSLQSTFGSDKLDCDLSLPKKGISATSCIQPQNADSVPISGVGTPKTSSESGSSPLAQCAFSIATSKANSSNLSAQHSNKDLGSTSDLDEVSKFASPFSGTLKTPSFSFSRPTEFKFGSKSDTFAQPLKTFESSMSKNGGFQFGSPAPVPVFDFNAKKENLTPVATAVTSNSTSASFNFGLPSVASAPVFKFGEPELSRDGNLSGNRVTFTTTENAGESTFVMASGTQATGLNGRPIRRAVRRQNIE